MNYDNSCGTGGETVASIAEQYQITPELLIEINEPPDPDNLVIGQSRNSDTLRRFILW